jgi:diguanylate cyclase (GGDEF)-like protein
MFNRPAKDPSRRLSPRWLLAAAAVVMVGFSAICGTVLLSMRRGDDKLAHQTLGNLATGIDADIARNVELYDLSLRNVAVNMTVPQVQAASPEMRQLILFDHAATARHFGAIQVLNETGDVTLDSSTLEPKSENFADEDFFAVQKRDPLFGLYISKPMLHNGAYGIVLSRRIAARDGAFMGVVAGFIRYSYFHEMVDRLQLERDDIITVMRQDGVIVMRTPFDMDVIGRDVSKLRGVQLALASFSGSYIGRAYNDSIQRLFIWREASHPLIVMVGRSTDVIFGQWRREAMQIAGAMGALGLIACGLMLVLAREMRKRAAMEDRMQRLAMTDGLTGLANRRHFDSIIEKEWQRALRAGTPISLLMIDADHFKRFNDTYGHQAGDLVLCGIAWSIARHAQRASDCAARYGGEEFALILPGLTLAEAIALGERIRIEAGGLQRDGMSTTTISVGAASLVPSAQTASHRLISDADAALYAAKANGRNQTWPRAPQLDSLAA